MIPGLVASGAAAAVFSPSDLTNLFVWFKADDSNPTPQAGQGGLSKNTTTNGGATPGGEPATADGDPVITWYSSSGSLWTQNLGGGGGGTYKTGGANGKPYVRGGNGFTGTPTPGWTGGITVFIVAKAGLATPTNQYVLDLKASDDQAIIAGFEASGMMEYHNTPRTNIGTVATGTWAVYEFVDMATGAASSAIGLKNGTATETLTGSSKTFSTAMYVFRGAGGNASNIDIAEIVLYKEGKGTTDRASVRSYLGTKYGITVV